jgi:hypothetical protein
VDALTEKNIYMSVFILSDTIEMFQHTANQATIGLADARVVAAGANNGINDIGCKQWHK